MDSDTTPEMETGHGSRVIGSRAHWVNNWVGSGRVSGLSFFD